MAGHRIPAGGRDRRRSRPLGGGVVPRLHGDRPQGLLPLGPLRALRRYAGGRRRLALDRRGPPPPARAVDRCCHGVAGAARRGGAGGDRRAGPGRHAAHRALVRGGARRPRASQERRSAEARRVRPPRQGDAARPPLPAPPREAQRHPARPVGGRSQRKAHRLVPRRLRHHRRPAARGQGRRHRPQSALARLPRLRRLDRHHRPARRALVHRRAPAPRVGPPRAAARSLRGGGEAQGGLSGVPPARHNQRQVQPTLVHPRGRGSRGARHQRAARRAAHPAPSRRP